MYDDDDSRQRFDEMLRSVARDVSRSVERVADEIDLDRVVAAIGADRDRATELFAGAVGWLRAQAGGLGEDGVFRGPRSTDAAADTEADHDVLRRSGPDPLDLPTARQGAALAALDSGRWTVEPGSDLLVAGAGGPGPDDALGLVAELRARDWIAADGRVTLVGRAALSRWLDAAR